MDRLSPERRSHLMSRIRGINTKPEMVVRRFLFGLGYRYTLHKKQLPGKPDIVFSTAKKIVLVHGCYWHGHNCRYGRAQSKTNLTFWRAKLTMNKVRDKRTVRQLRQRGWKVLTVWECQIKKDTWQERTIKFLEDSAMATRTEKRSVYKRHGR